MTAALLYIPTLSRQEVSNVSFEYHVVALFETKLAFFSAVWAFEAAMLQLTLRRPDSLPRLKLSFGRILNRHGS